MTEQAAPPRTFLDTLTHLHTLITTLGIQPTNASLGPHMGLHLTMATDADLAVWADHLGGTLRHTPGQPRKLAFSVDLPDGMRVYAQSAEIAGEVPG